MMKGKHARRAVAILLTLTMLCACSAALAENDWSQPAAGSSASTTVSYYATVRYATPLYVTTSTTGGYYGTLDSGDSLGVISYGTEYCYVTISSRYGYVLTDAITSTTNPTTVSYYVKTNTTTPLYKTASTTSASLGNINPNISVGVVSVSGSFYYAYVGGYYGYVLQSACTNTGSSVTSYVNTATSTPLYKTANTSGEVYSTLVSGRSLGVISTVSNFYYVYVDGNYGYVLISACSGGTVNTVSYYLSTTTGATLYKSANAAGEVYTTLAVGKSVGVISTSGSFYYVYVDGYYGYVLTSAFNNGTTTGTTVNYYVITNYSTPLYKSASTTADSYGNLNTGVTLGVISASGSFYYATVDGYYGYVLQSACTVTTTNNVTSTTVVASGTVNAGTTLYGSASTGSTPIGTISSAGKISIISQTTSGFYYVKVGSYYGYILSNTVSVTNDATVIPYSAATAGATTSGTVNINTTVTSNTGTGSGNITIAESGTIGNCVSWVSLREAASSTSDRLAKVSKGSKVTILGTSGSYTKVSYAGTTGYILSTYVA